MDFEDNERRFVGDIGDYKFESKNNNQTFQQEIEERNNKEITEGMQKYMPIGSVVGLEDSEDLKMIIGFNFSTNNQTRDYVGCPYPFGIQDDKSYSLFDHEQIKRVYHIGYINNLERGFKENLPKEDAIGR